ncbi:ammonia-forming cytochrome c nitrite reductase [bacterium]|jgi:nitrite reductase (cytochrome c-552)|nr:MAG: ammonia-forming cytochrome c nitrite reductase [bacterium]
MKNWILFGITIAAVLALAWVTTTIIERKTEAKFAYQNLTPIMELEPRNEKWGDNFPRQYESYMRTQDTTFHSKYLYSNRRDALKDAPELVVLWAGYGFSKDYNQPRGHMHAVKDIQETLRTGAPMKEGEGPMPSTCWTCKSPDVPRLMKEIGVAEYYSKKWSDLGAEVVNDIGCADCHDNETMKLTITRPALIEAFAARGEDITKATHQEMRSLVCAQCHVEYYFDKKKVDGAQYLTFPWKNGFTVEDMEKYYDAIDFADWTHPISKAKMLKAQHPDYEVFKEGIHAQRGVSCADCHMPYKTEGGQKFTDHHIQSPLANIENSCFVCHREKTESLMRDVFTRQTKIKEGTRELERLLVKAHIEAGFAWKKGATEAQMKEILQDIRHAQWRWDFSVASHGASFHAPVEISRIVTTATQKVQNARINITRLLAKLGHTGEVPMPDISTKEKAQIYVGLDIKKEKEAKAKFLDQVVPKWLEEAKQREAAYGTR